LSQGGPGCRFGLPRRRSRKTSFQLIIYPGKPLMPRRVAPVGSPWSLPGCLSTRGCLDAGWRGGSASLAGCRRHKMPLRRCTLEVNSLDDEEASCRCATQPRSRSGHPLSSAAGVAGATLECRVWVAGVDQREPPARAQSSGANCHAGRVGRAPRWGLHFAQTPPPVTRCWTPDEGRRSNGSFRSNAQGIVSPSGTCSPHCRSSWGAGSRALVPSHCWASSQWHRGTQPTTRGEVQTAPLFH
jgi:hypothetical protein